MNRPEIVLSDGDLTEAPTLLNEGGEGSMTQGLISVGDVGLYWASDVEGLTIARETMEPEICETSELIDLIDSHLDACLEDPSWFSHHECGPLPGWWRRYRRRGRK